MSSKAIQELCMENTQMLPWIWVIEALASSSSVDTSLLMESAKIIPDESGEMGRNAREAVSLRILEDLAAKANEDKENISDTVERIKFVPSMSCEDALQHILDDAPTLDVKNGGRKMLKWDIQLFIATKRARLNSSFLQKLKDTILEGSHSVLESLKEKSGISVRTRYINNILANGGHSDELVQKQEDSDKNIEAVGSGKTLNFTSTEKCVDELQENEPVGNLLPSKRNRSYVAVEDSCVTKREASKKQKLDENCPRHDTVGVTIGLYQHEVPVNSSEILVENVETKVHRLLGKEADVEDVEFEALNTVDKAVEFNHECHEVVVPETIDHIEHVQDQEASGNNEKYHDETSDVNLMKKAFLSLRCSFSRDSLATQIKLCMKCNNGEQVLVCSSETCPIVVHESCLGSSTVTLDYEGRFYCPFCAYSRAIAEYLEVRKRATLARKKLVIFIGQKVDSPKLTDGSDKSKINESKRDENLSKKNVPNNNLASSSRPNLEDRGKTKSTVPCRKQVDVAREAPCVNENTDLDVGSLPLKMPEGVISPDIEKRFNDVNERDTRTRDGTKIRKESASLAEAMHHPIEEESEQSVSSTHNIKPTSTPNLNKYQGHARNKEKIPWTSVEVEKLKEGVEKFRNVKDGVVPWRKILEYGADVFQNGRSGLDLKNKWRRISKGSPIIK